MLLTEVPLSSETREVLPVRQHPPQMHDDELVMGESSLRGHTTSTLPSETPNRRFQSFLQSGPKP